MSKQPFVGSQAEVPSAPPMESAPPVDNIPRETVVPLQGGANYGAATPDRQTPSQPPPSYQEAVNYPPAPPYPSYQPNTFPNASAAGTVPVMSVYPPYQAGGVATPNVYVTPNSQPPITTTHIYQTTVAPTRPNACSFCNNGTVQGETDVCCLLCLILLAIFTFPFGLVLLCCVPCTVRKRCNVCRRLYE